MKERPIIFSGEMVRAILDGRKTQTRRVVKPQPQVHESGCPRWARDDGRVIPNGPRSAFGGKAVTVNDLISCYCPYGQPGDRLWVRETWRPCRVPQHSGSLCAEYAASDYCKAGHLATLNRTGWKPSIHMPRWASRITLEVTGIRVERVQDISEDDAKAEGAQTAMADHGGVVLPSNPMLRTNGYGAVMRSAKAEFADLWDLINIKRGYGWDSNPWVWVVEFKQVKA